jgi:hypothetical protein
MARWAFTRIGGARSLLQPICAGEAQEVIHGFNPAASGLCQAPGASRLLGGTTVIHASSRSRARGARCSSRAARAPEASAREEMAHAERVTALARARGAEPRPAVVALHLRRSRVELALENASRGASRECWGAQCARFQAEAAQAADVRAAFARIAREEAEHAQVSRDIGAWLDARLDPASALASRPLASRPSSACAESSIRTCPSAPSWACPAASRPWRPSTPSSARGYCERRSSRQAEASVVNERVRCRAACRDPK